MTMRIKEIMKKDLITVHRSTTLRELIYRLQDFQTFPIIPVIDENNRLVGTVSFQDLIDAFQPYEIGILKAIPFLEREEINIFDLEISPEMATLIVVDDIMDTNILAIDEGETLENTYNIMKRYSIDKLPIVDGEKKLVGMIGIFNILIAVFKQKGILRD